MTQNSPSVSPPIEDYLAPRLLPRLKEGRENARTGRWLSDTLLCSERTIRATVEHLRRQGHLIGSSSNGTSGYYLIRTREELEATAAHLTSRAKNMLATHAAMRRAAERQFGDDALHLFDLSELS